jgi:Protein of unknown function (DUF1194)
MRLLAVLALAVCFWSGEARLAPVAAVATDVDLALAIAVDISSSIDAGEQALQREGYVAAFRHSDLMRAIAGGARGRIAVTYVEWAGPTIQYLIVPWTIIAGREDAEAFAAALAAAPLRSEPGTSISGGLEYAGFQFNRRDYQADRQAVDVSGDGPNNTGYPVELMRDWLIRRGVTVNGLPIMLRPELDIDGNIFKLDVYYEDCVIGGPGAFMIPVTDASSFETAIRSKLVLEIAGLPARPMLTAAFARKHRIDCLSGEKVQR